MKWWHVIALLVIMSGLESFAAEVQSGVTGSGQLVVATVERPPFSFSLPDGSWAGFSIDLLSAAVAGSGRVVEYVPCPNYKEMLEKVSSGQADLAIANISITSEREQIFDFSHMICESSIGLLVRQSGGGMASTVLHYGNRLVLPFLVLLGAVWVFGILTWYFERHSHPYFQKSLREALFPVFWWALRSTINNGGWDQEVPHTWQGRALATVMLLSSLVGITFFIGFVTAEQTVGRLESSVGGISDLERLVVATTQGSANSEFLESQGISYRGFEGVEEMYKAFEDREVDVIAYDTPMLKYYIRSGGQGRVLPQTYCPQPYGALFPEDSKNLEWINAALIRLREDGTFDQLHRKYF